MNTLENKITQHLARWWEPTGGDKLRCTLCPRYCEVGEGQHGFCYIRQNIEGKLYSLGYGRPSGFAIDPIEKKPLNHFLPGSKILSFGTAGCNLGCKFCQNWSISKARLDDLNALECSPEDVVRLARKYHAPSIAFTYNDPVIFGEYVIDIADIARDQGVKTVMVTAGYIDKKAREDVFAKIDAANVDLKSFSESFYYKLTSSHLADVLDTLRWLRHETSIWFEITTLLIPGENDSEREIGAMCDWVVENLGTDVPIHFTAFHPDFKMRKKSPTPVITLLQARDIGLHAGIKYCYVGNVINIEGQTTFCPTCSTPLIERDWHDVLKNRMEKNRCPNCKTIIAGVF